MAYAQKDWGRLFWSALAESVFSDIAVAPCALVSEVGALLDLNLHDEALRLSLSAVIPEDRLQLLSRVCNHMAREGLRIPDPMLDVLEECVDSVDRTLELTARLMDKIVDVCVDLFPVNPDLALKLVGHISKSESNAHSGSLMDLLVTEIFLKLGPQAESAAGLRYQFTKAELRDFARAASTNISSMTADDVLKMEASIDDVSAKLFLLRSWCRTNFENEEAHRITERALQILTQSKEYSPALRHLRHFAEPLMHCKDLGVAQLLLQRFDILKGTAVQHPVDEVVRLDLTLAAVEARWSSEDALLRFYQVYCDLDSIKEQDLKCHALIRMLLALDRLAPKDRALKDELERILRKEYLDLMSSSASHHSIARRFLGPVTAYDCRLAVDFASQINTSGRRDAAFALIALEYSEATPDRFDHKFLESVLERIENTLLREWVFAQAIRGLSEQRIQVDEVARQSLVSRAIRMTSCTGRAYACALLLRWFRETKADSYDCLYSALHESLENLETSWRRLELGFELARVLSKTDPTASMSLFQNSSRVRMSSALSDERLLGLYSKTCQVAIRLVPAILRGTSNAGSRLESLYQIIDRMPSLSEQCSLLNDLALRCVVAGPKDLFDRTAKRCLERMDAIRDQESFFSCLVECAPLLFEYERSLLYQKMKDVPENVREAALFAVFEYIISARPPSDPIDIEDINIAIDYATAQKACEIIEHMSVDVNISKAIEILVDLLVESTEGQKPKCRLQEKMSLSIAERLSRVISDRLPDSRNIRHAGWKVVCHSFVAKLRDAALNRPPQRSPRWNALCPTWEEIVREARGIANTADRVFVLSVVATSVCGSDPSLGESLMNEAETLLDSIPTCLDRSDRTLMLARSFRKAGADNTSAFLLEKALGQVRNLTEDRERERLIGHIIETAHLVDPSLASTLAARIDDAFHRTRANEDLLSLSLHANPSRIDQTQPPQYRRIVEQAAQRILRSFCSGRAITQHDEVIAKWMHRSLGVEHEATCLIASWFIENAIAKSAAHSEIPYAGGLFDGIVQLLTLICQIGTALTNDGASASTEDAGYSIHLPSLYRFPAGRRDDALSFVRDWLSRTPTQYVKIYDPWFREEVLDILRSVPPEVRIVILTTPGRSGRHPLDEDSIRRSYRKAWTSMCDQDPPAITVMLFFTDSGKSPLHNRYIISDSGGLELSTSLNGLGHTDSTIRILDEDERSSIEQQMINPLLIFPPATHAGERLKVLAFTI